MKTKLILSVLLLLSGCGWGVKPSDTITEVPVVIEAKITMPEKPAFAVPKLNSNSSQDEVLKAALKDLGSYKTYTKQLEKLLEAK